MSKHTPGPWVSANDDSAIQPAEGDRFDIARIYWPEATRETEWRANARLIAAAPELLEALADLVSRVDMVLHAGYVGHERIARCRAVIAKATEEKPCRSPNS